MEDLGKRVVWEEVVTLRGNCREEEEGVGMKFRYLCTRWMLEELAVLGILRDRLAFGDGDVVKLRFRAAL